MSATANEIRVSSDLRALRLAREKLGITRYQLAESLGVTYKTGLRSLHWSRCS